MRADYTSQCPRCDDRIEIGNDIEPGPRFEDNWQHVTCPDPIAGERLASCKRCGLEHRGEC